METKHQPAKVNLFEDSSPDDLFKTGDKKQVETKVSKLNFFDDSSDTLDDNDDKSMDNAVEEKPTIKKIEKNLLLSPNALADSDLFKRISEKSNIKTAKNNKDLFDSDEDLFGADSKEKVILIFLKKNYRKSVRCSATLSDYN